MLRKLMRRARLRHRAWRYRLRVDPREIRWLRGALRPGDLAVDAGAYKGAYTYWMRQAVGPRGRVIAFEPQPDLASYLHQCVQDFGWENVSAEHMGLSSEPGERTLFVPGDGPSQRARLETASAGNGRSLSVRVDSLDRYLGREHPDSSVRLIKCDVEGHELHVFEGARRTLDVDRPVLLFECEEQHADDHSVSDVFSHLEALGYEGRFAWRDRVAPVAEFLPDVHQVVGDHPYVHNFLFLPTETRIADLEA